MRIKNIYTELPVEEIADTVNKPLAAATETVPNRVPRKPGRRSKKPKLVSQSSDSTINKPTAAPTETVPRKPKLRSKKPKLVSQSSDSTINKPTAAPTETVPRIPKLRSKKPKLVSQSSDSTINKPTAAPTETVPRKPKLRSKKPKSVSQSSDPTVNKPTAAPTETVPRKPKLRSKKPKSVSQTSDPTNIVEFSQLRISNMSEDKSCNLANITHKKVTGANNWKSFLENNKTLQVANKENDEFSIDVKDEDARSKRKKACSIVAIDCEMVGIGEDGKESMLARVSIVNSLGECLYDTFVKPTAPVTDYRTFVSGVRACDLKNAEKFSVVQNKVIELLNGRMLVGHSVYNDLIALKIRHPYPKIRDTTNFKKFYQIGAGGTRSLKKLTSHFLNVDIQCGEHNSIQDAQAAMQLYMLYRKEWEADIKQRRHLKHHQHNHAKKKVETFA